MQVPRQVLHIALGPTPQNFAPAPTGVAYQRFGKTGEIAAALVCEADHIALTLREYDGWDRVLPTLVETFTALARVYITEIPAFSLISVQYLNEFRGKTPQAISCAELFREDGKWLAPFARDLIDPWHCHVGRFENITEQVRHLINVNFDVAPSQFVSVPVSAQHVRVLIFSGRSYDVAGASPLTVRGDTLEETLRENLTYAHIREKRVLEEIFTNDYLMAMGAKHGE